MVTACFCAGHGQALTWAPATCLGGPLCSGDLILASGARQRTLAPAMGAATGCGVFSFLSWIAFRGTCGKVGVPADRSGAPDGSWQEPPAIPLCPCISDAKRPRGNSKRVSGRAAGTVCPKSGRGYLQEPVVEGGVLSCVLSREPSGALP